MPCLLNLLSLDFEFSIFLLRKELSQMIEATYEKRLNTQEQEKSKDNYKPTLLQLGNIGSRSFGFNIYSNDDVDDVPISIR